MPDERGDPASEPTLSNWPMPPAQSWTKRWNVASSWILRICRTSNFFNLSDTLNAAPIPFLEAIAKLRERRIVPSAATSREWAQEALAIRERSFFSSRIESARLLQSMRDYLDDYLVEDRAIESHGGLRAHGRSEFVANMREIAIREGLGRIDPATGQISPHIRESDLQDIRSIARLELIFDTQTESAHEYGYWQQGNDPAILDVFPAQRFIRLRPVLTPRPYHEAALGQVRLKDDIPYWLSLNRDFGVPWGPWGFNSGCGVEDVDRTEAQTLGLLKKNQQIRLPSQQFNRRLQASTRHLSPDILHPLQRTTGATPANGALKARVRVADVAGGFGRLPGTMTTVEVPERSAPASARLLGVEKHPLAADLNATLTVLDSIHDDGLLGMVPLLANRATKNVGEYVYDERTGKPLRMVVSEKSPWPELTLLHEIGHWFDQQVFGGRNGFGTATGKWETMTRLVEKGETARELRRMIRSERSVSGGRRDLLPVTIEQIKTMARPEEIFARGYTEWICRQSRHPRLLELLEYADKRTLGGYGLRGADQQKFSEIMLKELQKKGWK